jgi:DNA-directed RNA polymerase subunit L
MSNNKHGDIQYTQLPYTQLLYIHIYIHTHTINHLMSNMKVSNIVETDNEMQFVLSGVDMCIANGLRRTMVGDVPSVVIKTMPNEKNQVDITVNTTRFHNEIVKQRLSCVPIHITDLETPLGQLVIELDVENTTDDFMYVTTGDIKIKNNSTNQYVSTEDASRIFPPNPQTGYHIDIARLRPRITTDSPGERLAFTARLSIGTPDENSMYNVLSTCCYGATQDPDKVAIAHKIKEQELKDGGMPAADIVFEMKNWHLLDAQRICLSNSFDFAMKTVGVYSCKEVLKVACDRIVDKLDGLMVLFKTDEVKIDSSTSTIINGYDVSIQNEDYTIGTLLQYLLYTLHYEGDQTMDFCGFKKFHPHDAFIMVRVGYKAETSKSGVSTDFISALNAARTMFLEIKNKF